MAKQNKYYVVWEGATPGVYTDWKTCEKQINGFPNARYKSFKTEAEAEEAYNSGFNFNKPNISTFIKESYPKRGLAVDAACSGNPGKMEYRGVDLINRKEVFHVGPFSYATNNIGEFLALVHGLALIKMSGLNIPIYSDSENAISWIKAKRCKTKLPLDKMDSKVAELIVRAEKWLNTNQFSIPIIKWETSKYGEIPADFGRK